MKIYIKKVLKIISNPNMGSNMIYCSDKHCFMSDRTGRIKVNDTVEFEVDEFGYQRKVLLNGNVLHEDKHAESMEYLKKISEQRKKEFRDI